MHILVAGANGLLGKSLVKALSVNNKVYALVKSTYTTKFNDKVNVIESDLAYFDVNILPKNIDVTLAYSIRKVTSSIRIV